MSKITIFVVVGFLVALFLLILQNQIGSILEDAMMGVTAKIVQESPLEEAQKQSIISALALVGLAGGIAFIGTIIALFKKQF